ncbi:hypothetical protein OK006_8546 [Actinobacteria bacterium OK006]|nr:hypothetical protein OK006_8546 [Actinobacteria bacterium OK006]
MCGRYVSTRSPEDLVQLFQVTDWRAEEALAQNWNVAPTDKVWAVLERMPPRWSGSCVRCAGAWCRPGRRT